jgi:hypothetical protein
VRILSTLLILVAGMSPQKTATTLNFDNVFSPLSANRYSWTVWLAEPASMLGEIKCVEYKLHPTFPNPVRLQCDPAKAFSLSTAGWGQFRISLRIMWKDGHETTQFYDLDLGSEDRQVPGATNVTFPLLEMHRLSPNKPVLLRWPGFRSQVAVSTDSVTLRSHGVSPFHIYLYKAPSAISPADLTLAVIKKASQRTTVRSLPARTAIPYDKNQYTLEALSAEKKGNIIIAVR